MSGVVKSVKKVFKRVTNVVKKIVPAVLAVGAVVFTAGAALGLAPLAGGWGGAVTAGLSKIGITGAGTIGKVLTGALTSAGHGAAIGGLVGAATGQGFAKGAAAGALSGAVVGGFGGLSGGAAAVPAAQPTVTAASAAPVTPSVVAPAATAPITTAATAPASGLGRVVGGIAKGVGNVLTGESGGQILSGLGRGGLAYMAAKEDEQAQQAQIAAINDRNQEITNSYSVDPSVYDRSYASAPSQPAPADRFTAPRYSWNRDTRRIERSTANA